MCVTLLLTLAAAGAQAKDAARSKDHPLVGRHAGAEITSYVLAEFNRAKLLTAPMDGLTATQPAAPRNGPEWLKVEGRDFQIRYQGPAGRSSLEVIENLKANLTGKGFAVAFECADADCFSGNLNDPYLLGWALDGAQQNGRYVDHARYLIATLDAAAGATTVASLVGEADGELIEFAHVGEAKPMQGGKVVFVDAAAMEQAISASGRVAIYGILFDTDRDTLRPQSKPTLGEIARMLSEQPEPKLVVAGHTDNHGDFDYNVDLSRRRATAVVNALVGGYGVARERLTPFGAGMAAPAASNSTEDGRQKNRRVELAPR